MTDLMIEKLEMHNFQCYEEEEVIFNMGVNSIYGSNGSGKSTILKAIFSSLFQNKAVKEYNLKIEDLIKNKENEGEVVIHFSTPQGSFKIEWAIGESGTSYCLLKDKTKNEEVSGVRNVGKYLSKEVGLDYEAFLASYIRQGEVDIITGMDKKDRQEMVDKFLGLEEVDEYRDNLKSSRREIKSKINEVSGSIKEIRNKEGEKSVEDIEEKLDQYKEKQEEYENKLESLDAIIDKKRRKRENLKSQITDDNDTDIEKVSEEVDEKKQEIKKIQKDQEKIEKELDKKQAQLEEVKGKISKVKEISTEFNEIHIDSYSGSSIVMHGDSEIQFENSEIPKVGITSIVDCENPNLSSIIKKLKKEMEEIKEEINDDKSKLKTQETRQDDLTEQKNRIKNKMNSLRSNISQNKKIIKKEIENASESHSLLSRIIMKIKQIFGKQTSKDYDDLLNKIKKNSILKYKDKILGISSTSDDHLINLRSNKKELNNINKNKKQVEKNLNKIEKNIYNTEQRLQSKRNKLNKIESTISELEEWRETYADYSDLMKKKDMLEKEISQLKERKNTKKERLQGEQEIIDIKGQYVENKGNIEEIENNIKKLQKEIDSKKEEKETLKGNKKQVESSILKLQQEKENIQSIDDREEELKQKKESLEGVKVEINSLLEFYTKLKNNTRGKTLKKIQEFSNQIFKDIYASETYSEIIIKNDFNILIKSVDGNTVKPQQLSGGEKIIVSLAIRCSIYKTIQNFFSSSHVATPPLILDEPTYNLDETHSLEMKTLVERLEQWFEQVIIVSHDDNIIETANNVIRTEKDINKSIITQD